MSTDYKISLNEDWKIQSSENVLSKGDEISAHTIISNNWIPATVPSTVLGTLVDNKIYENPYFGENLKLIPTEIFKVPWWYVCNFNLTTTQAEKFALLHFDGINYKANVWLNGQLIANTDAVDGAFRRTTFDVSEYINGENNILAIEVIPPQPGDFSTGFVDWNPAPPDGNMGVFRPVVLHLHNGISLQNPFIQSKIDLTTLKEAELTISSEVINHTSESISGIIKGRIAEIDIEQKITLKANSKKTITFSPKYFPSLNIQNPKLWWPTSLGAPDLYQLDLQVEINATISDTSHTRFGIRDVEDYWLNDIHRGYKINGQKLMIKGGGWTDDLFLMDTDDKIEAQVKYVKQMNLNCIRLEGIWGKDQKLYDLCDEYGILLMVGWSCHWEHEVHLGVPVSERYGSVYKPEHIHHIAKAWEDQVIWLRNHPSIFVWTVASDKVPITALEQKYKETFAKYDSTRPYLNSTGGVGSDQHIIGSEDVISEISGSSGVKMLGPYAYTAPVYWFTDLKLGGAYGFNTETGPGAQVPQIESLKKMIPKEELWPIGDLWNYHCGRYEFADLNRFTEAIDERYGPADTLENFDRKAQAMNYELMRPMFEAFQVYKKRSTGIIQWMLNAAWPKMYWQLYDYFLNPTGAFYATQKACSPLQLIYNYGNHQVYVVNDYLYDIRDFQAVIRIFDIHSNLLLEKVISVNVKPDSSTSLFEIEHIENLSLTYFLDLRLLDEEQNEISNNFYWLSTKEEVLDYEADLGEFSYHTPSKVYADLRLLNMLPKVNLVINYHFEETEEGQKVMVKITNSSDKIAFLINLKLIDKRTGELILPVFWQDNFVTLLPNEKRGISATFDLGVEGELKVEGWNY